MEQRQTFRGAALLVITACCALSAGCHRRSQPVSQAEQIRTVLNNFYATEPACLWIKPVTLERTRDRSASVKLSEARALIDAGLIDRERHGYRLTNPGRAFWRDDKTQPGFGNLCFGRWHVDRVTRMTTRPDDLFGDATETQFDATVMSPALWTRLPSMQQAFPLMALEVSRPLPHSATMKHTDKGWQIAVIAVPTVP